MKEKQENAIHAFYTGCNCAQSVISGYANKFNMDTKQVLNIASTFGGGMGRLQQTCGAVTGSYMLIGLFNSAQPIDEEEIKKNSVIMVQEFQKRFVEINGTDQCNDLIRVDLKTDDGQDAFKREELKEKICSKCINSAIEILDGLFYS